jgi:hypothetical protein
MGYRSDGLIVSQVRDGAAIGNLEDTPLTFTTALLLSLSSRERFQISSFGQFLVDCFA